jgi:prepilin-type N-terminal cleavage/methylation domain-containing protein
MYHHYSKCGKRKSGFTLIELLVVIAIIAILAAILFPVFARAREKARQTTCTSNQRQISASVQMFAQDHEETLPLSATFWNDCDVDDGVKICPTAGRDVLPGYVYNAAICSGTALGDPLKIPDASSVWLTCDGKNDAIDPRHSGNLVLSYVDGHCAASKPFQYFIIQPTCVATSGPATGRGSSFAATTDGIGLSKALPTGDPVPLTWPTHTNSGSGGNENYWWPGSSGYWIVYYLGGTYNLTGITIWNYYENFAWPNRSLRSVTLSSSIDSTTGLDGSYSTISGAPVEFGNETTNPWKAQYYTFSGSSTKAKWVKIYINSHWGGGAGLGEVRFVYTP